MPIIRSRKDLAQLADERREQTGRYKTTLTVCSGTGCTACGCADVLKTLRRELEDRNLSETVKVRSTGCHGFCEQGPLMVVEPGNVLYCHIEPTDVEEIVSATLESGEPVERLLYTDPGSGHAIRREVDVAFYAAQERAVLAGNKSIDPRDIGDYIAQDGYVALVDALGKAQPESIIEEIRKSGLRGRGGGGFPTAEKWAACRGAVGDPKFVICNADEGDPGAYMDRSILEGNPHSVIEGMIIGAYAIGARHGYIYVRKEYPLAVEHARVAVQQAEEMGLLGDDILGTDFSFDITIARGGGAFVCGESTALMASLEGRVGEPRAKDVHTTEHGFMDLPTNLNNVETWANVPLIMTKGWQWFASKGTTRSKGTKVFALTGKVKNTGLIEVPMGITLGEIIYDIGGGPQNGNSLKAVQIGGPSGGCLRLDEETLALPVDYETLTEVGAMVGSGGLVVMDEATCMVDVARYFLEFLLDEACGKCFPCRVGLRRMYEIVREITEGRGSEEKLTLLKDTAETVSLTSLCALGKTAANPVLTTIRYFADEYEAHIKEGRCPAGVCKELIEYSIDSEKCTGCAACFKACPYDSVTKVDKKLYCIEADTCRKCGICWDACKFEAVLIS
jgi:NADH-quinone oxidoreductase subunit F